MTPAQALQVLSQVTEQIQATRAVHGQIVQALEVFKQTLAASSQMGIVSAMPEVSEKKLSK